MAESLVPPEPRQATTVFGYPVVLKVAAQEIPLPLILTDGNAMVDVAKVAKIVTEFREAGVE